MYNTQEEGRPQHGRVSRSRWAGLVFPVNRIHHLLRKRRYAGRVGSSAPVYLAAVLQYLVSEFVNTEAKFSKRKRITPRHLKLGVKQDDNLDQGNVTIPEGSVLQGLHDALAMPARVLAMYL